jgi:hypothetical protein
MALFKNFRIRNFVKEKIVQIYATFEYGFNHPYSILNKIARDSTVDFILKNCPRAVACRSPKQLLDIAFSEVTIDGLFLEFGVFKGESLNYIAKKNSNRQVHGFDSFEGLPEAWAHNPKGAFTTKGKMPKVKDHVRLWKGYFEESLPQWCKKHDDIVAFLHIDCDLRSSTETVLTQLAYRIVPGTVILFDDYFNFPSWEDDGHAVLAAFLKENGYRAEYIGYAYKELAIIIR